MTKTLIIGSICSSLMLILILFSGVVNAQPEIINNVNNEQHIIKEKIDKIKTSFFNTPPGWGIWDFLVGLVIGLIFKILLHWPQ